MELFKKCVEWSRKKQTKKLKLVNEDFIKLKKQHMSSLMRNELIFYFELQSVIDFLPSNVNFDQNIESAHQHASAPVDGTGTTSPGVSIHTWMEMDVNRSVMRW